MEVYVMPDVVRPQVGDVADEGDIGYKGRHHKIKWVKCPDCGKERWVAHAERIDDVRRCNSCARKKMIVERDYRGPNNPKWKGRVKRGGYIALALPEHPRATKQGYVMEHIVNWEKAHNETLPKGYVVHHINGIRHDNRPENLVAIPMNTHSPALYYRLAQERLIAVEQELMQIKKGT
jgi:hypothetical protein